MSPALPLPPLRAYRLSVTPDSALERLREHAAIEAEVIPGVRPPVFRGRPIVMWRTDDGFRLAHRTSSDVTRRTGSPVYVEGSFLPDPTGGRATESQLVVRAGRLPTPARRWWNRLASVLVGGGLAAVGLALTSGSLHFLLDTATPLFVGAALVWVLPGAWLERRHRLQRRVLLTTVERALAPLATRDERLPYRG